MLTSYYIWFVVALCLAGGELCTGTFYLLAVAIGVAAGGLSDLLGASIPLSLIITAMVSMLIFVVLHRSKKRQQYTQDDPAQSLDIGQTVTIISWLDKKHARIQYRGTQWDAELVRENGDAPTSLYEIVGQKNNTFLIRKKH